MYVRKKIICSCIHSCVCHWRLHGVCQWRPPNPTGFIESVFVISDCTFLVGVALRLSTER